MRRMVIIWSVVVGAMAALFVITAVVLNSTVFNASGFVRVYLDSLARHDAQGALAMPGVELPDDAMVELLRADAMAAVVDIRVIDEVQVGVDDVEVFGELAGVAGLRFVDAEVHLAGLEEPLSVGFVVAPADPVLGVFNGWRFAESPLAVIYASALHDDRFEVNGVPFTSAEELPLAAFVPGRYELTHESSLFTAEPVVIPLRTPGGELQAAVDIRASAAFEERVQEELDGFLDECSTQTVLLPAGCPFGQQIINRVESDPVWSIAEYPRVQIVPGPERGTWMMPRSDGTAHLTVQVRSLFDGSLSMVEEDVPFSVSYRITVQPDGRLEITASAE